jgi:hypothetical protein
MGNAIPTQHPAVVLRSHYRQLRALLAIAMIAVVGLSAAVVILANDGDEVSGTSAARPTEAIRYGGFNPATGRPDSAPLPQREAQSSAGSTRYDGGPEEGSRGIIQSTPLRDPQHAFPGLSAMARDATGAPADDVRYDGGPEEGTRGELSPGGRSNTVSGARYDGGPEEGSRGSGH